MEPLPHLRSLPPNPAAGGGGLSVSTLHRTLSPKKDTMLSRLHGSINTRHQLTLGATKRLTNVESVGQQTTITMPL